MKGLPTVSEAMPSRMGDRDQGNFSALPRLANRPRLLFRDYNSSSGRLSWRDRISTFYTGNNGALGQMQFNCQFTSDDPTASSRIGGYGGADFDPAMPVEYQRGIPGGERGQRVSIFAVYLQDDWRATECLTVNLGPCYEAHTPG